MKIGTRWAKGPGIPRSFRVIIPNDRSTIIVHRLKTLQYFQRKIMLSFRSSPPCCPQVRRNPIQIRMQFSCRICSRLHEDLFLSQHSTVQYRSSPMMSVVLISRESMVRPLVVRCDRQRQSTVCLPTSLSRRLAAPLNMTRVFRPSSSSHRTLQPHSLTCSLMGLLC
jgi:hypothetical protein